MKDKILVSIGRVKIVADFGFRTCDQLGLWIGTELPVSPKKCEEDGDIWVCCPAVEFTHRGVTRSASAGYVELHAGEYEWLDKVEVWETDKETR